MTCRDADISGKEDSINNGFLQFGCFCSWLLLKQISENNLDNIYEEPSDPVVYKYYGVRYLTREETIEQIKFYKNLEETETGIGWAIYGNYDPTFIGAIGFNNYQKQHNKIELGFWLIPSYWRNGYLNEAAIKFCDFTYQSAHGQWLFSLCSQTN